MPVAKRANHQLRLKLGNQLVKERNSLLKSFAALGLISLCLIAANWQFHRGQDRHKFNSMIEENIVKLPLNGLPNNLKVNEWRSVKLVGKFLPNHLLQRNSYHDGEYGFEYLSEFETENRIIWVDRGWVKAGANAKVKPELPFTPQEQISIEGRIRSGSSLVQGRYFALPTKISNTKFRVDLIKIDGKEIKYPAQLPELNDGPHYAYALQWIFFAGLIMYGRLLIRRQATTALSSK